MDPVPDSLKQLADQTCKGGHFSYLLGDFLDAFYRRPRMESLADVPPLLAGCHIKGKSLDAFLAATAESLAVRQGWRVPGWVFEPERYLHQPFFPVTAASLRATLLLESPPAFRARNIFVTANALSRA